MNWDQIEGSWKQIKGKAKAQWGRLTDDELDVAAGRREQLIGIIQERYGYARDRAEREVDEAIRQLVACRTGHVVKADLITAC